MSNRVSRRKFLALTSAAGGVAALGWTELLAGMPVIADSPFAAKERAASKVQPFPMEQVRLRPGIFQRAMEINRRYLMALPNDRLLHTFRVTAGLPSTAEPLGGWEAPKCELRGHFAGGHYLSACALTYASTGDQVIKAKAEALVVELARCQDTLGTGYLSAYPVEFYDRLRDAKKVWAPFYTYHKIMAGHLDMYQHCGNEQALRTTQKMADWVEKWVAPLSDEHMARVQETEFGGMNEVLYNLFAITGEERYLHLGRRFDDEKIFAPLADGRDELMGHHANTNIPKIIGAARAHELTGEQRYFDIASYFWKEVTARHTYCTGGTSDREFWHEQGSISTHLGSNAEECCCSYNMMKLSRHLYGLTGNPEIIDYYERLLHNARLGTQDPDGLLMYFISTAPGLYRTFGSPYDAFYCCTGTGVEEFAKLADTIYFHDAHGIYVNLFIASEVRWPEKGLKLVQETQFPEEETTTLRISAKKPIAMALSIRVPYWAKRGLAIRVNGAPVAAHVAGGYAMMNRTWKHGDKIEVALPMSLHTAPAPDDPSIQAMMYGPLVLAGLMGTEGLTDGRIYGAQGPALAKEEKPAALPAIQAQAHGENLAGWVKASDGEHHRFTTVGQAQPAALVPFYKVFKERYTLYWKVEA